MENEIEKGIDSLRKGHMIILRDSPDRENEGDLAVAAEFCSANHINEMLKYGRGIICVAMEEIKAKQIGIELINSFSRDDFKTNFGYPIDLNYDITSGVSARDRAFTIRRIVESSCKKEDFYYPGHVSTLIADKNGILGREGHTEGIIELLKISKLKRTGVLCEILSESGEMANKNEIEKLSNKLRIPIVYIRDIKEYVSGKKKSESRPIPNAFA